MKTIFSLAALAALASTPALAGGLNPLSVEPVVTPVAPVLILPMSPSDWTGFYVGGQAGFGTVTATDPTDEADVDFNVYGLHAGYNYDLGSFVVGAEAAYDSADLDYFDGSNNVGRLGARVGYDLGRILPFGTAGFASLTSDIAGSDTTDTGYYYGFGVDYAVTNNITAGVQLLRHQFDDFNDSGVDIEADAAQLRVSYNF